MNLEPMQKAAVLIEALPYIQRFNRKIVVVKYGGSAMVDEELKKKVIQDVVLLKLVGFKPIIVHGGGKEISRWVGKVGMEPHFVNGLRVTDEPTMEIAEMVLNKVNKSLVQLVNELGIKAVGISGKDGRLMAAEQAKPDGKDIGYVGTVKHVDTKIIYDLLDDDFLPIIYPIGIGEDGQSFNINGDYAAEAIAEALKADKLAFLTDTSGVYEDINDEDSFVSELYTDEAKEMIEEGIITGGMIPKVQNCLKAIEGGVNRVHILDGRIPHCLLLEIFTDRGCGTAIMNPEETRYYNQ